jgi:hypothetical protein
MKQDSNNEKIICGIVMPISSIDNCSEEHWEDVKNILTESINNVGYEANLVSLSDDVGVIQKRIIDNLYNNPIVVCDVSGKNPNVMFELGMRLAFDKPVIIIKDDQTKYTFDTAPIEHIEYPRDLRYSQINVFKEILSKKIKATKKKSETDSNYTTFLKHFGDFKVAKIDKTEVSGQEYMIDEIKALRLSVEKISGYINRLENKSYNYDSALRRVALGEPALGAYNEDLGFKRETSAKSALKEALFGTLLDSNMDAALKPPVKSRIG